MTDEMKVILLDEQWTQQDKSRELLIRSNAYQEKLEVYFAASGRLVLTRLGITENKTIGLSKDELLVVLREAHAWLERLNPTPEPNLSKEYLELLVHEVNAQIRQLSYGEVSLQGFLHVMAAMHSGEYPLLRPDTQASEVQG